MSKTIPLNFPVTGPWDFEQAKEAYNKASSAFEKYKGEKPYVALVESHHEYTTGYWVEFEEKEVKYPDLLLKCNKPDTQLPAEVDPEILWDEHSALIGDDIDDLSYWSGRDVMKKDDFFKAVSAYATKLNQAQQEITNFKMTVTGCQDELTVLRAISNGMRKLLEKVIYRHEGGLLPDRLLYNEIKTFLDGTK